MLPSIVLVSSSTPFGPCFRSPRVCSACCCPQTVLSHSRVLHSYPQPPSHAMSRSMTITNSPKATKKSSIASSSPTSPTRKFFTLKRSKKTRSAEDLDLDFCCAGEDDGLETPPPQYQVCLPLLPLKRAILIHCRTARIRHWSYLYILHPSLLAATL